MSRFPNSCEYRDKWGRSSVGRAPQSHCGGQGFKSPRLHQSAAAERLAAQSGAALPQPRTDGAAGKSVRAQFAIIYSPGTAQTTSPKWGKCVWAATRRAYGSDPNLPTRIRREQSNGTGVIQNRFAPRGRCDRVEGAAEPAKGAPSKKPPERRPATPSWKVKAGCKSRRESTERYWRIEGRVARQIRSRP